MRFTVGTTSEGKPAVYLGRSIVGRYHSPEWAASMASTMNDALKYLLDRDAGHTELACIFLNAGEGWIGKEPATVRHAGVFDVHGIEVAGDVDAKADAALTWTPKILDTIGEQLRERLGEDFHESEDFDAVRSQAGL